MDFIILCVVIVLFFVFLSKLKSGGEHKAPPMPQRPPGNPDRDWQQFDQIVNSDSQDWLNQR